MKNPAKLILIIPIIITMALSASGCSDIITPVPEPPTPSSPPSTPPPSPASPSPKPAPEISPEPEPGPLQLGEYYYLFGDPQAAALLFNDEGLVTGTDGFEALFELTGLSIVFLIDGEPDTEFMIIDSFSIEEPSTGMLYIRRGGAGFGGLADLPPGPKVFFTGRNYYLNGDAEAKSVFFYDAPIAILTYPGTDADPDTDAAPDTTADPDADAQTREYAGYTIIDNEITITIGDEVKFVFIAQDPATLKDTLTGEKYGLEGLLSLELVLDTPYYQFGDPEELYICFRAAETEEEPGEDNGAVGENAGEDTEEVSILTGEVSFGVGGVDMAFGTFTLQEQTLTVDVDGESTGLVIINNYVLRVSDQDVLFIRTP